MEDDSSGGKMAEKRIGGLEDGREERMCSSKSNDFSLCSI